LHIIEILDIIQQVQGVIVTSNPLIEHIRLLLMKILVINGPNLQLLGKRDVDVYGTTSLKEIEDDLTKQASSLKNDLKLVFSQSNHEGEILDKISSSFTEHYDGIIINPAAYSHTSIAIYDALKAVEIPAIEVHISNIYKREKFRQHSIIAAACVGQITGLGINGYGLALQALIGIIES
jgi:3-dehydroquinate dehydratase II